jgi:signal transduction histidine kinase
VSLRLRLVVVSLAAVAVGMGALLVIGNVLLSRRAQSEASSVLKANAEAQISALDLSERRVTVRRTANDAALDRRSWVLDGASVIERPPDVSPALDRAAVALGRQARAVELPGPDETRLRVRPVVAPGTRTAIGAVVVVFSMESFEHLQHAVLLGSLVVAALVLIAVAVAIRGAVNGALRPVAQMTESAHTWSAGDLEQRFDLGPARDELTGLAATLDEFLARIAASRRHEQRFASDVAHELRTPLAGLRLRAELALGTSGSDEERREALRAVVTQVDRLGEVIDTLLAVARHEVDPAEGSVDLVQLAREFDDLGVDVAPGLPLAEGDPDVVRRALTPLVDNARRHARSQVVIELSLEHGRVRAAVRDDGPGVDSALAERVFDAGVRGHDIADGGAGLGLALSRRLARSCGGDVVLGEGPGGCFVLELPALGRPSRTPSAVR